MTTRGIRGIRGIRAHAVCVVLLLIALVVAVVKTRGVHWPGEDDFFRDISTAQSILDGRYPSDPSFAGEVNWYNPLSPWIVARLSSLFGLDIPDGYATFGKYLNLISPIGFYVFALRVLGRPGATVALGSYLFLGVLTDPSWVGATYSPWMWPVNLMQGPFFIALTFIPRVVYSARYRAAMGCGLGLGLVFLGHTGPALLLATSAILIALVALQRREVAVRDLVKRLSIFFATAFVVSLPYSLPILLRYRFKVRNWGPIEFFPDWQSPNVILGALKDRLQFRDVVALVGVVLLVRAIRKQQRATKGRVILSAFGIAVVGWIGAYYFTRATSARFVLPPWHFFSYFEAFKSLLFGFAVTTVLSFWPIAREARRKYVAAAVVTALIAIARFKSYLASPDYADRVAFGRECELRGTRVSSDWIRGATPPDATFWCTVPDCMIFVVPSGRKVVLAPDLYSNPYVDLTRRTEANDRVAKIVDHLGSGSPPTEDECASLMSTLEEQKVDFLLTSVPKMNGVIAACDDHAGAAPAHLFASRLQFHSPGGSLLEHLDPEPREVAIYAFTPKAQPRAAEAPTQ